MWSGCGQKAEPCMLCSSLFAQIKRILSGQRLCVLSVSLTCAEGGLALQPLLFPSLCPPSHPILPEVPTYPLGPPLPCGLGCRVLTGVQDSCWLRPMADTALSAREATGFPADPWREGTPVSPISRGRTHSPCAGPPSGGRDSRVWVRNGGVSQWAALQGPRWVGTGRVGTGGECIQWGRA